MTVRMALQQAQVRGGGIFLDGVYRSSESVPVFHEVRGPTPAELERCFRLRLIRFHGVLAPHAKS